MQQVKLALTQTTAHGLPRVLSSKPIYVRVAWLLLFLLMFGLFLESFCKFVTKLRSRKVTSSIEWEGEKFQFPDVYMCFENPVSGSYSSFMDSNTVVAINDSFSQCVAQLKQFANKHNFSDEYTEQIIANSSLMFLQGLPYKLLFDKLAHRVEQSVISSSIMYLHETGLPTYVSVETKAFNHPLYLRCLKWTINSTLQDKVTASEYWAGLTVTLLLDTNSSFVKPSRSHLSSWKTGFPDGTEIPVSDWLLSVNGFAEPDRLAAVKLFLSPPGEYPSEFVSSFSLSPGKYHTVEIEMVRNLFTENQFDCLPQLSEVHFTNPYDLSAYSHAYSYSYCYYFEYHRQFQSTFNISGSINPLPWQLRNRNYLYNCSATTNYLTMDVKNESLSAAIQSVSGNVRTACKGKRLCSTLDYSASISSADWPTQSSLNSFISFSVRQAWSRAKARNLSVPALDFLMTGNASSVASYVRDNLLKVHIKPGCVMCNKITFSIDYDFSSFVSEVGGIMGIYLGMSLLTLCELLELLHDIIVWYCKRVDRVSSKERDSDGKTSASSVSVVEIDMD